MRSLNTKIWSDEWFEQLSQQEKLVWIYLLTNPYTNMLGIYKITIKRIAFDTGITIETVSKCLKGFEMVKKCIYNNGYIILPNWMKNQRMNPNMVKSARSIYEQLPEVVINELDSNGLKGFESLSNGSVMVPNYEVEVEDEIEDELEIRKGKNKINVPAELCDNFTSFLDMRKTIKKPPTELAKELIIKKLETLAPGNFVEQNEILLQSIRNSWQDVYPLKQQFNQPQQEQSILEKYPEAFKKR